MIAPKQRTAILAASLALLVSSGVALQAFAETPVGLRDTRQADYGATVTGAGALSAVVSGWEADSATLAALDALDGGRFAASVPAAAPDFSRLVSAFVPSTDTEAAFAAPVAADALRGALRASGAERTLFANAFDISPELDLSSMVAAFGASDGRLSFSQAEAADQLLPALRSEEADSSLFAAPAEAAAPDMSAMTASLTSPGFAAQTSNQDALDEALRTDREDASLFANTATTPATGPALGPAIAALGGDVESTGAFSREADVGDEEDEEVQTFAGMAAAAELPAISGAFAAQTAGVGTLDEAMRSDRDDASLFAGAADTSASASDLTNLGSSLTSYGLATQSAGDSDLLDAMRAGGEGEALFAREVASGSATLLDIGAVAAALSSDSMEQGGFAASAQGNNGWRTAMQAEDTSSSVFSGSVTSATRSVDFAALGAALSGEE